MKRRKMIQISGKTFKKLSYSEEVSIPKLESYLIEEK